MIGTLIYVAFAALLGSLTSEVGPHDPTTIATTAAAVVAIAAAPMWLRARRAARINPAGCAENRLSPPSRRQCTSGTAASKTGNRVVRCLMERTSRRDRRRQGAPPHHPMPLPASEKQCCGSHSSAARTRLGDSYGNSHYAASKSDSSYESLAEHSCTRNLVRVRSHSPAGRPARLACVGLLVLSASCHDVNGPEIAVVGSAGGVVTSKDGAVSLNVPATALAGQQQLHIRALSSGEARVASGAIAGTAVALEPAGLVFTKPAMLSFKIPRSAALSVPFNELTIVRPDGSVGEELATTVDSSLRVVSAPLNVLSTVWVRAARVGRIGFTSAAPSVLAGGTTQLGAQALADDGRVLLRPISWSVRSPAIADVDAAGRVRGLQSGSTWVIAQSEGVSDSVLVRVTPRIQHIEVSPSNLVLLAGDTVQMQAIAFDSMGAVVADISFAWKTSDSVVAVIAPDGVLVARRSGPVTVLVRAQEIEASAQLTVEYAASIVRVTDAAGVPVQLGGASGALLIDLVTSAAAAPARDLALSTMCSSGSSLAVPGLPGTDGSARLRVPSDTIDATGRAALLNGACTMTAEVTTARGTVRRSPAVALVLANPSGFLARYSVAGVNAPFGAAFPTSVTGTNSVVWHTGSVSLDLQARNFDNRQSIVSVRGMFLEKAFDATLSSQGHVTLAFPNSASDPNGRAIADLLSPPSGSQVVITNASFADGSPAPIHLDAPPPLFIDNQAPQPVGRFSLPAMNADIGWIAGTYGFLSGFTSAGDGAGVGVQTAVVYAAPSSLAALPNGTAMGSACTIAGLRAAASGADALAALTNPAAVTNRSLVARIFEADRLGNVRCTELSTGPFGVDVIPPTITRAAGATPDRTIWPPRLDHPPTRFDVVATDAQSGLVDPHRVWRRTIAWRGFLSAFCLVGWDGSGCNDHEYTDTLTALTLGDALWQDLVYAVDRVGNRSATLDTRVIENKYDRGVGSWSGFPSVWVGGSSYTLSLTAGTELGILGIMRITLTADYTYSRANMVIDVDEYIFETDRFRIPGTARWSGTLRIPNFTRQLEQVDASEAPYDDSGEYTRAYGLEYGVEVVTGGVNGEFYGLGDKNMQLGYTYFGKGIRQFRVATPSTAVSNGGASGAAVALTAMLTLDSTVATPFNAVCFYYRAPNGHWRSAACTSAAATGESGSTRTLEYRVTWNPPTALGTSGSVAIRAIGTNTTGDGLVTNTNTAVSLIP